MARRAETQNQQQQRTWRLIFSYTLMIPITDSRSRMWRCWLAFGLLSYFLSLFLSRLSVCLFDCFFLSFFASIWLFSFLFCFAAAWWWLWVVLFGITKDTRARHKVVEGKQRSQKRVQKSTKAPKTVLRTRHPVTTPFIAPVLSHLFSLFPVSIKKSPVATITWLALSLSLSLTHTLSLSLSTRYCPPTSQQLQLPLATQTTEDATYTTLFFFGLAIICSQKATLKIQNAKNQLPFQIFNSHNSTNI